MSTDTLLQDDDWQAFLYIQDELTGDELASFESRLDQDTGLCETLANAVLLCESTQVALNAQASKPKVGQSRPTCTRWFVSPVSAILLTVCLLMALFVGNAIRQANQTVIADNDATQPEANNPDEREKPSTELVQLWVRSALESEDASAEAAQPVIVAEAAPAEQLDVPDWLLAAVEYEQSNATPDGVESQDANPFEQEGI